MGVGREQKRATIPEIHMVENELKQCVCVGGWGGGVGGGDKVHNLITKQQALKF